MQIEISSPQIINVVSSLKLSFNPSRSLGWEDLLEEDMATHSSILAWRITRTEGPGGLPSIESQRITHDWSNLACMHALGCRLNLGYLKETSAGSLASLERVCLQCRRPGFNPWVGKTHGKRKWQPTPVLLPGKSHGQRSLVGYRPWGHKESEKTERLHFKFHFLSAGSNAPAYLRTPLQFVLWTDERTCTKPHFASVSPWHGGAETAQNEDSVFG